MEWLIKGTMDNMGIYFIGFQLLFLLLIAQYPPAGGYQPGCCRFYTVASFSIPIFSLPVIPAMFRPMLIPPLATFSGCRPCTQKKFNDLITGNGKFNGHFSSV
ncbi:MAG: hypothetical protein IPP37_14190 [Saprospiraceae bacterium]|nr:hypothetical protein [Saprospiraceae bacterium]